MAGLSPGATGGSANAIVVAHNHTVGSHSHSFSGSVSGTTGNQSNNHSHTFGANTFGGQSGNNFQAMDNPQSNGGGTKQGTTSGISQDHNHSFSGSFSGNTSSESPGTNTSGSSGTNANLPPYYSLCYVTHLLLLEEFQVLLLE